jgi:mitogen-activated protein kinase 1/3
MARVKLPAMENLLNVGDKYKVLKRIGTGAFGMVCEAINNETGERVAIKHITNLFEDIADSKRLLREISILKTLNHPCVVRVKEIIVSGTPEQFDECYIVMEHAQSDLKRLIKSPLNLEEKHIKTIAYNIICAIHYIHSADILHRDLKPANILVNEDCEVKICDFGLARGFNAEAEGSAASGEEAKFDTAPASVEESAPPAPAATDKPAPLKKGPPKLSRGKSNTLNKEMTGHVVTRWYRAPELILMEREYTKAIDVWSVGCILAELNSMLAGNAATFMDREPLFPGSSCFPLSPDLKTKQRRAGFPSANND